MALYVIHFIQKRTTWCNSTFLFTNWSRRKTSRGTFSGRQWRRSSRGTEERSGYSGSSRGTEDRGGYSGSSGCWVFAFHFGCWSWHHLSSIFVTLGICQW